MTPLELMGETSAWMSGHTCWMIGLNSRRNKKGVSESSWKTPLLMMNGDLFHSFVLKYLDNNELRQQMYIEISLISLMISYH